MKFSNISALVNLHIKFRTPTFGNFILHITFTFHTTYYRYIYGADCIYIILRITYMQYTFHSTHITYIQYTFHSTSSIVHLTSCIFYATYHNL